LPILWVVLAYSPADGNGREKAHKAQNKETFEPLAPFCG
jgi:hypothetical protein